MGKVRGVALQDASVSGNSSANTARLDGREVRVKVRLRLLLSTLGLLGEK